MSKILALPPKSISASDKKAAEKAGFIVIEIDDPSKLVIIDENQIINGSDMALVALASICGNNSTTGVQAEFTRRLYNKLSEKNAKKD